MDGKRDPSLFRRWLEDHKGIVLKIARAFTASPEDRDDLFQEIALQLWRALPSFRGDSKPSTWIYKIGLNKALTWQRGEGRRGRRQVPLIEVSEPATPESQGRHALLDRLYGEIRKLAEIDRSLLLLMLDGVPYGEMAQILGLSESNIGVRLNRAKKKLARAMKEGQHHGP